ncbi:putative ankyrin [Triangularia verruculosa]|uniref:Ankyrin n=1 Tax=Triangularia verruculosa TaxID=2587418 RepID=A0AAN7ATN9_9PEZI|nr:putative ankyrin [Triangularia verruculosa]
MENSRVSRLHPDLAGYLELRKHEYNMMYDRWANEPQPCDEPPPHWPPQRCMLNRLPHELPLLIFRYLYQADLFHLALACHHLANLAIPVLYSRDIAEFDCLSLRWACTFGILGTLDRALRYGASVNHRFEHGTALGCAWVLRDTTFHECALNTPLKLAIFTDDVVMVRILCEEGVHVNVPDTFSPNCTVYRLQALCPLHHAIRTPDMYVPPGVQPGNPRIVRYLLDAGADPNQYSTRAWSTSEFRHAVPLLPLVLAMQSDVPVETVRLLLERGADPMLEGQYDGCHAVEHRKSTGITTSATTLVRRVFTRGEGVSATALKICLVSKDPAVWQFNHEKVRLLLQYGAALEAQHMVARFACNRGTPSEADKKTLELLKVFVLSLSEPNGLDMVGFAQREVSPFLTVIRLADRWVTHASFLNDRAPHIIEFLEITTALLTRLGEVCAKDGESSLGRNLSIVDMKDSSSTYDPGWETSDLTALRWLCMPFRFLGSATLIAPLLREGADMNKPDSEGMTPLHFAAMFASGHRLRTLVEFLGGPEVSGLAIDARDITGWTPLHFACFFGLSTQLEEQVEAARLLLDNGADIHAQAIGGWTPLSLAVKNANLELVRFLLERGAQQKDMFGPPGHESLRGKMFFCRCLEQNTSDWTTWRFTGKISTRVNQLRHFAATAGAGDDEFICPPSPPLPLPRHMRKDKAMIDSLRAANVSYEHETLSLLNPFIGNSPALDSWGELVRNNAEEYADQVLHNLADQQSADATRQAFLCSFEGRFYNRPPTSSILCVRMCHIGEDTDDYDEADGTDGGGWFPPDD